MNFEEMYPSESTMHITVCFKKLVPEAMIPRYNTPGDAGLDLHSIDTYVIAPGKSVLVKTGISLEIPPGYVGMCCSRSGLALKKQVFVLNAPGIIDFPYRGEMCAILFNLGDQDFHVAPGDRIAQLVITPVATVTPITVLDLTETVRGQSGFGSTGQTP